MDLGIPVYTPRQLFTPPAAPEGWIELAAQWVREQGGEPKDVGAATVSGRLIIAQAPQWGQRIMIGKALQGALETPEAREMVAAFQTGTAISLAPWGRLERFVTFREVVRRVGDGRYVAGWPPNEYNFAAPSDYAAYRIAIAWCAERRKEEIQAAREKAILLRDQVAKTSRIIVDVYELLLRNQGLLLTANGDVVTWENGAHDLYVCEARTWCYGLECSPSIAVAYYLLALQDRQEQAAQVPKKTALQLLTAGVEGWHRTGPNTFAWKDGSLGEDGTVMHRRQAVGQVRIEAIQKRGCITRRVVVRGRGNKLLDEGVLSVSTSGSPASDGDAQQDMQELAMAWGVFRALDRWGEKGVDQPQPGGASPAGIRSGGRGADSRSARGGRPALLPGAGRVSAGGQGQEIPGGFGRGKVYS